MEEKNQPTPNPRVNSTSSTVQYTHTLCNKEVSGFYLFNQREREREVLPSTHSVEINFFFLTIKVFNFFLGYDS